MVFAIERFRCTSSHSCTFLIREPFYIRLLFLIVHFCTFEYFFYFSILFALPAFSHSCTFLHSHKLLLLNPRVWEEHLAIQPLWVTAQLLVTCVRLIYLEDEIIFSFLVELKEMRTPGESKVLSFLFLMLIKGMRRWSESKISLCNPRGRKLLHRSSVSGLV